jgi:hypothetical protein
MIPLKKFWKPNFTMAAFTVTPMSRKAFICRCWRPIPKALILTGVSATGTFAGKLNSVYFNMQKLHRLKSVIFTLVVCSGFCAISCHKEDPEPEPQPQSSSPNYEQTFSLAGQTWLMYKMADSVVTDTVAMNDTLRFIDATHLTWRDSACTYLLWVNVHSSEGNLKFFYTPIGSMDGGDYHAPLNSDSLQFMLRFMSSSPGYNKYCWFRRL